MTTRHTHSSGQRRTEETLGCAVPLALFAVIVVACHFLTKIGQGLHLWS